MKQKLVTRTQFAALAGVSGAAVTKACAKVLKPALYGKHIDENHSSAQAYIEARAEATPTEISPGVDGRYIEALEHCASTGRFTATTLVRGLGMGHARAKRIIATMAAAGHIPADRLPLIEVAPPTKTEPPQKPKVPHVRGTAAAKVKKKAAPAQTLEEAENTIVEIPENIQSFLGLTLMELIDRFGTDVRFSDWLSATQKIEAINEKRLKNAEKQGVLVARELVRVGVVDVFNSAHLRLLQDGSKSIAAGVVSKHLGGAEVAEIEAYVVDILGSFIKPVKAKVIRTLMEAG